MRIYVVACLVSAALGVGVGLCVSTFHTENRAIGQEFPRPVTVPDPQPPASLSSFGSAEFTPEELVNIAVYDTANRGVVHIMTKMVATDFFFESPREGSGSGSVLDRKGHILTNYHVIEDAQRIRVTLFNGNEYDAGLVGQDRLNDIAVLRIDAPPEVLFPVAFGDSSRLRVGQRVYAIGNPFGLERTMTTGIISSLNRTLPSRQQRTMKSIIQIDAALNQGNSGGPLLDNRGRLIGMNTAIASSTGANTGVGFAIPVNTIARVVPQLIEKGRVTRPEIGIAYMVQTSAGPAIVSVTPGGPADRAGLRGFQVVRRQTRRGPFIYEESRIDRESADIVTSVDGVPVKNVDDFVTLIETKQPGQEIVLGILRDKQPATARVRLGAATEP